MSQSDPIILRSFAGGEITPALGVRADVGKYQISLHTCRNFLVQRHGGVANRPGLRFVNACKTDDPQIRLMPFIHEDEGESMLIEHGANYFRFYQNGGLVELTSVPAYNGATAYEIGDIARSGGVNYYATNPGTGNAPPDAMFWYAMPGDILEVPSPFNDPFRTRWVQSGRVIALTHRDVRPHDLIHVSPTQWVMRPVVTTPQIEAPDMLTLTVAGGALQYGYVVTAIHPITGEESVASAPIVDAAAALPTQAAPHEIGWAAQTVDGLSVTEFMVYCDPYKNGTYGFIGQATNSGDLFFNPGITPDFLQTPPLAVDRFNATNEYPNVCGFHQQRRFYANTKDAPDAVYASRVGYYDNFGNSSPLQDDDALSFKLAGNNNHAVEGILDLKRLVLMTDGGEWAVGQPNQIISPSDLAADQETYVGISDVAPLVVGNSIIYVQARGAIMRELRFDQGVEGFNGKDLTVYAEHLFRRRQMHATAYQQNPNSVVWVIRNDGTLLGLTYIPEEDVWGWHRHDTGAGGFFEDVVVVPEYEEDVLYCIVRRTIGGVTKRYIERLENRDIGDDWSRDVFFVDSGLTYDGPAVGTVSGLSHIEGQTVAVVADGLYIGDRVVSGGGISLGQTASIIHVGLRYTCDLTTLALDMAGSALRERTKRVASASIYVEESSRSFQIGRPDGTWTTYEPGPNDQPSLVRFTGRIEAGNIYSRFEHTGQVFIRQSHPLPLTVLGIVPNVEVGG